LKGARNQWILLGFISQALSWETYVALWVSVALWIVCVALNGRGVYWRINSNGEALALLIGCFVGYSVALALGESPHFFIGHGITAIQITRLLRPLNRREKIFSTLAALVQVGVACVVILDSRFFWIFLAALYLLPRTLMELEHERRSSLWNSETVESEKSIDELGGSGRHLSEPPSTDDHKIHANPEPNLKLQGSYLLNRRSYMWILLIALTFFFTFPRGFLGSPIRARGFQNNQMGSLADSIMDPTSAPSSLSKKTLLQLEGEDVGYLRSFAFVKFDGVQWTRAAEYPKEQVAEPDVEEFEKLSDNTKYLARRVRVKNIEFLGSMLPVDGQVVRLKGEFFRSPKMNSQGAIECSRVWNASRNIYEYWIRKEPEQSSWSSSQLRPYLQAPPASEAVQIWLKERVQGIEDPLEKARVLETYFHENFTYELGAPKLNRLNPTEDFLIRQKTGHCERYASALAYLLRLEGIPTRVVVGYAPSARNWWSGWYDIRFEDAHAWIEAYIVGKGWIEFDATPRASMPVSGRVFQDILDALDVAWYMNVVNFDSASQIALLQWTESAARQFVTWTRNKIESMWKILVLVPLLTILLAMVYIRFRSRVVRRKNRGKKTRVRGFWETLTGQSSIERAYAKMEKELARKGIRRASYQTPLEFSQEASLKFSNVSKEILWVGVLFSAYFYGKKELREEDEIELLKVMKRISSI
jgi:transglutaminase-like putative cysteine protease